MGNLFHINGPRYEKDLSPYDLYDFTGVTSRVLSFDDLRFLPGLYILISSCRLKRSSFIYTFETHDTDFKYYSFFYREPMQFF